jgi:propanol-preferring alcohol dehydrogenase
MQAMVLDEVGAPLKLETLAEPTPGAGEVLVKVLACGICRTDLHILDGELDQPKLPLVPGHQIVGEVVQAPDNRLEAGTRVGIPWLGGTCGHCEFCSHEQENLCPEAVFTGYQRNGGFAEYVVARERFCFPLPENQTAAEQAPLLCAGLIGYRAWRFCGDNVKALGLYGFGSAAHILTQVAHHHGQAVYAFTRPGDEAGQKFARAKGACWAGDSDDCPPVPLDAAIVFAPVGELVPAALKQLKPGGRLVLGGIHMSDIPPMPYRLLWEERRIQSVANLTRRDGTEFFRLLEKCPIKTDITQYRLDQANEALEDLRQGRFSGSGVIVL